VNKVLNEFLKGWQQGMNRDQRDYWTAAVFSARRVTYSLLFTLVLVVGTIASKAVADRVLTPVVQKQSH